MHPEKSPGPNGFNPAFYQRYWSTVGNDVVRLCQEFFSTGTLPIGINDTHIVLIPKKSHLENVTDLQPIGLYNVVYRVSEKVLANRLRPLMPHIIFDYQIAFMVR